MRISRKGSIGVGQALASLYFGDGSDGDATISAPLTLTKDMYYRNLTIAAGASVQTAGFRIFVSATLDLTAAPTGAIHDNGLAGGDAVATAAGAAGVLEVISPHDAGSWHASSLGSIGKAGSTTVGVAGTAVSAVNLLIPGGPPGTGGGAGGAGSSGAGGAVGLLTPGSFLELRCPTLTSVHSLGVLGGGLFAAGPGSGGGDGTAGGGSGGSAPGGGMVAIFARTILRSSANTNTGIIQALTGRGGNGGVPAGGNRGGGGGAPGSGGGNIYILCGNLAGSAQPNALDVSGGPGGNGGAGTGTGTAGQGGQAGFGGVTQVLCLSNGSCTVFNGRAIGGNANSGVTGGASTPAQTGL